MALLLGLLVLHLGLDTLARLRSAQAGLAARSDRLLALRVTRHVLRRELGAGRPGVDWGAGADTLWLRAFRGTALVCPPDTISAELEVSFTGQRSPDPSKDSVVLVTALGASVVRDLVATGAPSGQCALQGGEPLARWVLDAEVPEAVVLARLFERGSYHLSDAALRYRRGLSGRQPLTPGVWGPATGWSQSPDRLGLELVPESGSGGLPWNGFLSWQPIP